MIIDESAIVWAVLLKYKRNVLNLYGFCPSKIIFEFLILEEMTSTLQHTHIHFSVELLYHNVVILCLGDLQTVLQSSTAYQVQLLF